jgi:hypothetical protein
MKISVRSKGRVNPLPEDRRLIFDQADVKGADFSARRLDQFVAISSRFDQCSFEGLQADNVSFGSGGRVSEYIACSFDRSHLRCFAAGVGRFTRCSFRHVQLRDFRCTRVECIECVFSGQLKRGHFSGTVPEEHRITLGRAQRISR